MIGFAIDFRRADLGAQFRVLGRLLLDGKRISLRILLSLDEELVELGVPLRLFVGDQDLTGCFDVRGVDNRSCLIVES